MSKKPTLSDIAAKCGVGVSTVSRVLNKVDKGFSVKAEIRKRILTVARELNYSPNFAAKNLRKQKTNLILIYGYKLEWSLYGGFYINMLNHAVSVLENRGYETHIVLQSKKNPAMLPMMMDGAMMITASDRELAQELSDKGVPCVILNDIAGDQDCWVATDDCSGMSKALDYLYQLGHRKIVYCAEHDELSHKNHHSISDRLTAYNNFMETKGLYPWSEVAINLDSAPSAERLLQKIKEATAIITYDHFMAQKIQTCLTADGVKIPEEKSLICFSGCDEKLAISSPITCMHIPLADMGREAASILLKKMDDHHCNSNKLFEQDLIIRETTGPV